MSPVINPWQIQLRHEKQPVTSVTDIEWHFHFGKLWLPLAIFGKLCVRLFCVRLFCVRLCPHRTIEKHFCISNRTYPNSTIKWNRIFCWIYRLTFETIEQLKHFDTNYNTSQFPQTMVPSIFLTASINWNISILIITCLNFLKLWFPQFSIETFRC